MDKIINRIEDLVGVFARPVIILTIILLSIILARLMRFVVKFIVSKVLANNAISALSVAAKERTDVRRANRIKTLSESIASFFAVLVYLICIVWALSIAGVQIGKLLAGAGLIGVALGFGAQTVVRDMLAGFFIISEDWYGVGDNVDLGEVLGTVAKITLRTTSVRDYSGILWSIPNGEIKRSGNKSSEWARIVIDVPILYSTDIESATKAITRSLSQFQSNEDGKFIEVPTLIGVQDLTASSASLRVVAKTMAGEQYDVARDLRKAIKLDLEKDNIDMPKGFFQP